MLIKTRIVTNDAKDNKKNIEIQALINIRHISLVLPTAIKGQVIVVMRDGKKHTLIADPDAMVNL